MAISFETANGHPGSACAVGLVRLRNGVMVDQYSSFINYPRSLGGFEALNTELHGITPKDLIGAPLWQDVLPQIINFIADDYVVAYNASYDMDVLTEACEEAGIPLPNISYFCSRQLAKAAVPGLDKYRITDLVEELSLGNFTTHDTEANALVSGLICVRLAEREEMDALAHIMGQYGIRDGKLGLGRGYYSEQTVLDVAPDADEEPPAASVEAVETVVAPAPVRKIVEPEKAAQPASVAVVDGSGSLPLTVKGERISFVGGFDLADRTAAKEKIAEQGGKYLKNVRADTTILVIGVHINPDLEGIVAARSFNAQGSKIKMMSKDEFFGVLGL